MPVVPFLLEPCVFRHKDLFPKDGGREAKFLFLSSLSCPVYVLSVLELSHEFPVKPSRSPGMSAYFPGLSEWSVLLAEGCP